MNKKKYLSPTMRVVEVNAQQMICQSVGTVGTQQFTVGESYDSEDLW